MTWNTAEPNWAPNEEFLERWLVVVAESHGKLLGEVQIVVVTDEELLEINRKFLDHDYYTDIISFDYSKRSRIAGELWISLDRTEDNAAQLGVEPELEFHRVVVHGVLHFLGFGDKSEAESMQMRVEEDKCLLLRANMLSNK